MLKQILFAVLATSLTTTGSADAKMVNPKTNHPSYWGSNCVKTEKVSDHRYFSATTDDIKKVIVKGGPTYAVYSSAPFKNLTAPVNPNNKHGKNYGISHVIVCYGETQTVEPPVKPQPEPDKPVVPEKPQKPTPTKPTEPDDKPVDKPAKPGVVAGNSDKPETGKILATSTVAQTKGVSAVELPAAIPATGADSSTVNTIVTAVFGIVSYMTTRYLSRNKV